MLLLSNFDEGKPLNIVKQIKCVHYKRMWTVKAIKWKCYQTPKPNVSGISHLKVGIEDSRMYVYLTGLPSILRSRKSVSVTSITKGHLNFMRFLDFLHILFLEESFKTSRLRCFNYATLFSLFL